MLILIKFILNSCVCVCVCLCGYMYTRLSMLIAYFICFFFIYTRLSPAPSTLNFVFLYSICKNIQVRCYIVSTVKKFYIFSLEYGMQSDRPQNDLRRSKANPNPRTQVKRHRKSTSNSSIGHAACEGM